MKPSRRTKPRRTDARRTNARTPTARGNTHAAQDRLTAQALNASQDPFAGSGDQLAAMAEPPTPLSLQSGAARQYWDEVLRLFMNIRADCDAAAERLGYLSPKDDGLAAVEYIANKVLQAVAGERQQQMTRAKKQPAPKSPEVQPPIAEARPKSDNPAQPSAGISERAQLIGELKQMLRDGKTKAGVVVDPPLTH